MSSTMSAGDLLWVEATRDVEAEHEAAILASASVAAAPLWATVVAAESDADFHNRVALLETSIQAVASSIAPMGTPDHSLVVTALPAQWYEDWSLAHAARQAEAQKRNARRMFERNQQRAAAKTAGIIPDDDTPEGRALRRDVWMQTGATEWQEWVRNGTLPERFREGPKDYFPVRSTEPEYGGGVFSSKTAAIIAVQGRADSFGNWHVSVTTTGVGDEAAAEAAALEYLREELAAREGPNFAPEVVGVKLNHRDSQNGMLTFYYDETNAHEASRKTASATCFHCHKPIGPGDAGYKEEWGDIQIHDGCIAAHEAEVEAQGLAAHQKWWDAMEPDFRKGYEEMGFTRDKRKISGLTAAAIPGVDCAGSGEGVLLPEGDKAVLCPHCGNSFSAQQWGTYTALGETYVGLPVHLAQGKTLDDRARATATRKTARPGWWTEGVVGKQYLGFPGSKIIDVEPTVGYLMNGPVSDPGYYDEAAGGMVTYDFDVTVEKPDGTTFTIGKPYRWLQAQQAASGATVTSAREDYEHWNEDADRIWWEEEGRHGGDTGLYYCDMCGVEHGGLCPYESRHKQAAGETGAGGWPLVDSTTFPGEKTLSCPKCGSQHVIMSGVPGQWAGWSGRSMEAPGSMNTLECADCGNKHMYPRKAASKTAGLSEDDLDDIEVMAWLQTAASTVGRVYVVDTDNMPMLYKRDADGTPTFLWPREEAEAAVRLGLVEDPGYSKPAAQVMDPEHYTVTYAERHGRSNFYIFPREASKTAASEPENITLARKVLAEGFYAAGEVLDQFSASAIVQVYEALSGPNKERFGNMSLEQMVDVAFKLANRAAASKTAASQDVFDADMAKLTDALAPWARTLDDGSMVLDPGAPADLVGTYQRLMQYGYANGLMGNYASKVANSFPPDNDVADQPAADPAPAAPGAPQQAADPLVDVATAQVGGVIMEPGDGVVHTYTINDVQDNGDSMLLTVTKDGGEEMQLQIPKTEKVQIHQPDAPKEKPEAKPAEATPAAGEEKEKSPFPPKAAAFGETSPEKKKDAYDKQQADMAEGKKVTNDRMREAYEKAKADGDDDMAEFWKDYLQERGIEVDASKTALDIPVETVDGDEKPTETRIVPAAQSEGKYKVEGRFSDGWKNLMPDVATKEECEEWLRTTTMFGLNAKSSLLDRVIDRAARLVLANGNPYTDDNPYMGDNAQSAVTDPAPSGDAPAKRDANSDVPEPEKVDA